MEQFELDSILSRVALLEKHNRALRIAVFISFVILTSIGSIILKKGLYEERLSLHDKTGNISSSFELNSIHNLGQLRLEATGTNHSSIWIGYWPSGDPYVLITGKEGNPRISFGVGITGWPYFQLYDEHGQMYWSAPYKE